MITEDYVSFEIAKLLKEKGFDTVVRHYYQKIDDDITYHIGDFLNWNVFDMWYSMPTLQMAMKWLREIHNIHINVVFLGPSLKWTPTIWKIDVTIPECKHIKSTFNTWESYEEACEVAIKYCLENLI